MKRLVLIFVLLILSYYSKAELACPSMKFNDDKQQINYIEGYTQYSTARLIDEIQGRCVGKQETYIVLYNQYGDPWVVDFVEGHHLEIKSHAEGGTTFYTMRYKAGGHQTILGFFKFNNKEKSFTTLKKFASNIAQVDYRNGVVTIKNQITDEAGRNIEVEKYKFNAELGEFVSI